MVYKHCIEKKVEEKSVSIIDPENRKKFAETYLNFHNIAIVPHHGKSTALYLIKLCKHFGLEYFAINDRDFEETVLSSSVLGGFNDLLAMQADIIYTGSDKKGMITTNFNLIKEGGEFIHFNLPKLEGVIGYTSDDKNSYKIHQHLNSMTFTISISLFPDRLIAFLGINSLS